MKEINSMKMMKIIEKNAAEILVFIVFIFVMSSCQTVREMNMSGSQRSTQCTQVSR